MIGSKNQLNFDEFYDIMAKSIQLTKKRFKDIEFESNTEDSSCLFCPYAVNK